MGQTVDANGRSILHKGHGMTHTCAVPDVCKTPTPAGPVPIPYPNIAMDSNLTDGADSVQIEGNPVANVGSKIATSTGDEPGSVGGVMSNVVKGTVTWKMGSLDVKAEGKSVVRFLDTAFHNGNTFNTSFINMGGTGFAYGDDQPCDVCSKAVESHRVHVTKESEASAGKLLKALLDCLRNQRGDINDALIATGRINLINKHRQMIRRSLPKEARLASVNVLAPVLRAPFQAAHAAANARLQPVYVLNHDEGTTTYTYGYMIGVALCRCKAKAVAAASGTATVGFKKAVADCGFELAEEMPAATLNQAANLTKIGKGKWECAAPKLLKKLGAHKPATMMEVWFQPSGAALATYEWVAEGGITRSLSKPMEFPRIGGGTVSLSYDRTENDVTQRVTEEFGDGATCPSCDKCKANLPEMLCNSQGNCPE